MIYIIRIVTSWPIFQETNKNSFTRTLNAAIDNFFPVKTIRSHPTDKPWITGRIKQLIKKRQRGFHTGDVHVWRQYRRSVQKLKRLDRGKIIFMPKKSITCGKTMYANGGISSIQFQAEQYKKPILVYNRT